MSPKSQRWWLTTDSRQVVVDASPDRIYDLVADMTRMGEWSPECQGAEWTDGATEPVVGARFIGHNRGGPKRLMRWSRRGRIIDCERGRAFAFATEEGGKEGTVWRYTFEPVEGGTVVTESYTVQTLPVWARIVDVPTNRHRELVDGMAHTLELLKKAAESLPTPRHI
jgi:uncharacterized protein YndB with AHSA1/START domain